LYKRRAKPLFDRMRADIGTDLILTSGVRGIPKQSALFLTKLIACDGNVSMASRSLAPPGYSFHLSGDFDVGSSQLAGENFSRVFARSEVYRKMQRLPYVTLRYPDQNQAGVRFEPWHVKVVE
jgi:D-alanyl-D-alanine carboxypeptidase